MPHDSTFKTLVATSLARRAKLLIQWSGINPLKIKCLLRFKALQLKIQDIALLVNHTSSMERFSENFDLKAGT